MLNPSFKTITPRKLSKISNSVLYSNKSKATSMITLIKQTKNEYLNQSQMTLPKIKVPFFLENTVNTKTIYLYIVVTTKTIS
jgi:hypothetical protein